MLGGFFQRVAPFVLNSRLSLKFSKNIQNLKRDLLRFFSYDKSSIFKLSSENSAGIYNQFSFALVTSFTKKLFLPYSNNLPLASHLELVLKTKNNSFVSLLFRLNVVILFYVSYASQGSNTALSVVVDRLLRVLISNLVELICAPNCFSGLQKKGFTAFLVARINIILNLTKLSPSNLAKLLIFFCTSYLNGQNLSKTGLFKNVSKNYLKFLTFKFNKLNALTNFYPNTLTSTANAKSSLRVTPTFTSRNFFLTYLKAKT